MIKNNSESKIRRYFLVLYILINLAATLYMLFSGELMGDLKNKPYLSAEILLWSGFLVVISYCLILSPTFNFFDSFRVVNTQEKKYENLGIDRIGIFIFILQILFLIFNNYYGVNIAGAGNTTDNKIASYAFIMLDPDYLFFIYYGLYRQNKYFYPNFLIWCVSNLMRGWNGILIFIVFFELCRLNRLRLLSTKKIALFGLIIFISYPILSTLKWIIRGTVFSNNSFISSIGMMIDAIEGENYFTLLWIGLEQAIGRLQVVSLLAEVIDRSSQLQADYASFKFLPFWLEGLHGIAFDRIFYGQERDSIGVLLNQYLNPNFEGSGNTNISYPGWFFIAPYLAPIYICYTLTLGFLSMYFIKKIKNDNMAKDTIWLVWVMYLMPPWLGAMIKFIYSALFFLILKKLFSRKFL